MFHKFPKKYHFIDSFDINLLDKINPQIGIIYRNYNLKILDFYKLKKIKYHLKKRKVKFYIANNIKIAVKLNLDGVYIIEYIHKGMDHKNIMHTLVIDGVGKHVCDSNYGVVQYKELNVNNYYFLPIFVPFYNVNFTIYGKCWQTVNS